MHSSTSDEDDIEAEPSKVTHNVSSDGKWDDKYF